MFTEYLPGQERFLQAWAEYIGYPQMELLDITHLLRYSILEAGDNLAGVEDFLSFYKKHLYQLAIQGSDPKQQLSLDGSLSDIARKLGLPKYPTESANAVSLVAKLPLPIYITTSHHRFLEQELEKEGKEPQTDVCFWRESKFQMPTEREISRSRNRLKDILNEYLDLSELQELCFRLDIDYENVKGEAKPEKVMNLIKMVERHRMLTSLVENAQEINRAIWDTELDRGTNILAPLSILQKNPDYIPSVHEPLVYHVFGLDDYPETLIITEDDYLDFLFSVAWTNKAVIPNVIRAALAETSLLMLGYNLHSWDFKILFRGLIASQRRQLDSRGGLSVSIQLEKQGEQVLSQLTEFHDYLRNYFSTHANFEIYWGSPDQFMQDLWSYL